MDRLKPAFVIEEEDVLTPTKMQRDVPTRTKNQKDIPAPTKRKKDIPTPTKKKEDKPPVFTRYGRRVKFRTSSYFSLEGEYCVGTNQY